MNWIQPLYKEGTWVASLSQMFLFVIIGLGSLHICNFRIVQNIILMRGDLTITIGGKI